MNAQPGSAPGQKQQAAQAGSEPTNLSHRYGSIGIEAVAAAARYAGAGKNPAYAPAVMRTEQRQHENAV